ncbi:hypothetical protein PILCRDRAFT_731253 [Piloderma croceum F 1598]|uniref:DUF6697 domain-containing protein n=1 Tax=Piloderma croceum (strain F 1598) TaxID=765440 RepID=A0A0C3B7J1_PILCF|nr:hypothetical protein PILCRDRAFT_731253 [Piloderma croceum F 1598]
MAVKRGSEDFSTTRSPGANSAENTLDIITPTKKRRLVFDGVEVPTLLSFAKQEFGVKSEPSELKKEEIREKLDALKNHNIKQSNDAGFLLDTVHSRMRMIGYELYDITVPAHILDATFSRQYTTDTYGGNMIHTFPTIAQKHVDRHGLRDFMFLNLDFNPYAPQIPGSPGLFFECEMYTKERRIQRVFTRHAAGKWQLQGLYELVPCLSLTKDEWRAQKQSVRNTWHKNIHEQGYGRNVRARITLRDQLGREPKVVEVEEAIKDKGNKFKTISVDDVVRAYDCGDEAIAVWCMKCVGYDEEFQRTNIDGFAAWKMKKADEARDRVSNPINGTKSKKRANVRAEKRSARDIAVNEDVKDYADVIPRGTRSRPMRGIRIVAQQSFFHFTSRTD